MDWIRRNWPDLLIGVALLAVISGIVATLLTGGSFFGSSRNGPPPPATPRQASQTRDAGRSNEQAVGGAGGAAGEQAGAAGDERVDPFAERAAEAAETPEAGAAEDEAAAAPGRAGQEELPAVVALRPGATPETPPAGQQDATPQQAAQEPAEAAAGAAPAPAQETAAPAAAPAATPAQAAGGISAGTAPSASVPFTVGVGAFRAADNAERQAGVFRQAGYPVIVSAQDELSIVLLGPYGTRSEAERVRDAVNAGGFDVSAIVYTYQGAGDSSAAEPAPAAPATQAASPPAEPAQSAAAATSGRYLQVGAYSSDGNAAAQRQILEGLGYEVVERQDGNLIRILVGPWPEEQLAGARDRLAGQGIDSVPY